MRISDWSSDVCSSDLVVWQPTPQKGQRLSTVRSANCVRVPLSSSRLASISAPVGQACTHSPQATQVDWPIGSSKSKITLAPGLRTAMPRSEEHTSALQSLMRISYAVFCLKKKNESY